MQAWLPSPRARDHAVDVLLACFVTAAQVQGTMTRAVADPQTVVRPLSELGQLGVVLLVVSGAVLVVRRRFPVVVFVVAATASATYYGLGFPDGPGWLALFVALYGLTAYGDGRRSLAVAGSGIAFLSTIWLLAASDIEPRAALGWVFFRIGASVMSAALGESVRTRGVIADDALARAKLAEQTREELALSRVVEERLRIAREVHDTVAHAIAVINVQSGVAAHLLAEGPSRTRETLQVIEQTSSRALDDMRSILGVLRDQDETRMPHPGLDQVGDLVAAGRDAGLDIELRDTLSKMTPLGTVLPTAVDSTAYRIVQEAITNVIRHVGPARVAIGLDRVADDLELHITNGAGLHTSTRPAATVATIAPGRGIAGMRERCLLLGGDLRAGPLPTGGFEITARLPLAPPTGGTR